MKHLVSGLTALFFALILTAPAALATDIDTRAEIENLRHRLEMLEKRLGEEEAAKAGISEVDAEEAELFTITNGDRKLMVYGAVEVEAAYENIDNAGDSSDLSLATALLGFEARLNEHVGSHLVFLYEEGEDLAVDEANIVLGGGLGNGQFEFIGGRLYLPFGIYNSSMLSDPLTLELGETANTAGLMGWSNDTIGLNFGVFSGEHDAAVDSRIDTAAAAISVTPAEGVSFGASWISDLAESGAGMVTDAGAANYQSDVAGASLSVSLAFGIFTVDAEYLFALDKFSQAVVAQAAVDAAAAGEEPFLTGRSPRALSLEVTASPAERWIIAGRYEQAEDFAADARRYGATVSYGLFDYTAVAVEYLYTDFGLAGHDPVQTVTGQVAVEF